ncbi:aminotransferase class IV [Candidatus Sumerlaeota bacterium]|nr:aminotransferase class IV [Candidatus Sumerlaeota bacterium]
MTMGELLYLNGEWMPIREGHVSCEDRGFNFGDGVYEVVRVYGGQPFTMREHLERQVRSAAGLGFEIPLSVEQFEEVLRGLIERSGIEEALIYTQVTRGAAPRNHIFADDMTPTVMAFIRPAPPHPKVWRIEGAGALPCVDNRWNMCHLKTIALLPNILAKNAAHRAGFAEAFFHLEDGTVTEGSASNSYVIRGGEMWTAPLGPKILPGITRTQVMEVAREIGLTVHEETFTLTEAEDADEIIMSASNLELLPIVRLGERSIGKGKIGPVYRRLHEAYRELVRRRCGLAELVPL